IEEVRTGKWPARVDARRPFVDTNELLWRLEAQRPKHDPPQHAEDGGASADADGQHQDAGGAEAGSAQEGPAGETKGGHGSFASERGSSGGCGDARCCWIPAGAGVRFREPSSPNRATG